MLLLLRELEAPSVPTLSRTPTRTPTLTFTLTLTLTQAPFVPTLSVSDPAADVSNFDSKYTPLTS